jgi:hypothetical protein
MAAGSSKNAAMAGARVAAKLATQTVCMSGALLQEGGNLPDSQTFACRNGDGRSEISSVALNPQPRR